ncbi:hypothetical protein E2C01_009937 [Portunus trituberculatus]|uniref:Uncharacterized protein n=1 Tax=Portunus trituberculatus TaxID=210409 RepID=A0A5B7D7B9_PORTR|nr:hypothetical protein [Portunus trituberculatus]
MHGIITSPPLRPPVLPPIPDHQLRKITTHHTITHHNTLFIKPNTGKLQTHHTQHPPSLTTPMPLYSAPQYYLLQLSFASTRERNAQSPSPMGQGSRVARRGYIG